MSLSEQDAELIAAAVAKTMCHGGGACCATCRMTPEEHAQQHAAIGSAMKVRSVVWVKAVEWGTVFLLAWAAAKFGIVPGVKS